MNYIQAYTERELHPIINFALGYMQLNYPVSEEIKNRTTILFTELRPKTADNDGNIVIKDGGESYKMSLYPGQELQWECRTLMHECYHLHQLSKVPHKEWIANRWPNEIETENFCRINYPIVEAAYLAQGGIL